MIKNTLLLFLFLAALHISAPALAQNEIQQDIFWYVDEDLQIPKNAQRLNLSEPAFEVQYTLPRDCNQLLQHFEVYGGNTDMTTIRKISRSLDFCKKSNLLDAPQEFKYDLVSSIDFSKLSLDRIPYNVHCTGVSGDEWFGFCDRVERQDQSICYPNNCDYPLSLARFILREPEESHIEARSSWILYQDFSSIDDSCRLLDSEFVGKIEVSNNGTITCSKHPEEFYGYRLELIGFRDINQDSYLDAILKVCKINYVGCYEFALTKTEEDGELRWLEVPAE